MKKVKDMARNKKLLFWTALIIALVALGIFVMIMLNAPLEIRTLDVKFEVSNKIGADLNGSALTFGKLFPGNSATRNLKMTNNRKFPVDINFLVIEDMANLISVKNLTLQTNESALVPVTLYIPKNMSYGNYSGKLKVVMTKSKED